MTVLNSQIPYNQWKCVSEKCLNLQDSTKSLEKFYSEETICKKDLIAGFDFEWSYLRQTFSMDWGFYLKDEAKLSLVSSVPFMGMFLGLTFSTALLDKFGRKIVAMIAIFS